ncbi:hypothetical protein CsSME_00025639 [Camellia sinensis var. sinensis]
MRNSQFGSFSFGLLPFLRKNSPFGPWDEAPYKDAAEKTALGGLSLDGFLSETSAVECAKLLELGSRMTRFS